MLIIKRTLLMFFVLTLLTGVLYPAVVTGLAQVLFNKQANGSLLEHNGKIAGSSLIGQKFTQAKYLHGRPSAADYDASNSTGSNLGSTNKKLLDQVQERKVAMIAENNLKPNTKIPSDLLYTSASGLDPHISQEAAQLQVSRIAKVRNISEEKVKKVITKNTEAPAIGIFGKPLVNVVKVNLALDN